MKNFDEALKLYMENVARLRNAWMVKFCPNIAESHKYVIERAGGRKYIKVTMASSGSKSVHSFVNFENGDIYKAAGWNAPALNAARGNIFFDDGADALSYDGQVRYL